MTNEQVVIVDLDGTLYKANTFHIWMIFIFKLFVFRSPLLTFKISWYSILRISGLITHSKLKFNIMKLSEKHVQYIEIVRFVRELDKYINDKVLNVIQNNKDNSILVTAAPILYVQEIAKHNNIMHCIATPKTDMLFWKENICQEKVVNLKQKFDVENIDILLTDHYDDLPLMLNSRKVILVNPNKLTIEAVNDNTIVYEIL